MRPDFSRAGIIAVVAVGLALAGCGKASDNPVSNGNRSIAEATLTAISANITISISSNPSSLPQLTQQLIGAVQNSESLLGADEAKQKLTQTAWQIAPYCSSCAQNLTAASAQVGQ